MRRLFSFFSRLKIAGLLLGVLSKSRPLKAMKGDRWGRRWLALALATLGLCVMTERAIAAISADASSSKLARSAAVTVAQASRLQAGNPKILLNQARTLYESGRLAEAIAPIQSAIQLYRRQQNPLGEAMALSNLALIQEQQGNLGAARETIAASLNILNDDGQSLTADGEGGDRQSVLAQTLNVQAQILLSQGQPDAALNALDQATELFEDLSNEVGSIRSQIRRAQALQTLGFHQAAVEQLQPLYESLRGQPNSPTKVSTLRSLAEAYYQVGNLDQAERLMNDSLALAQRLNLPQAISTTQLGLANILRAQAAVARILGATNTADEKTDQALDFYTQVGRQGASSLVQAQAQLNRLSLLIDTEQFADAVAQWQTADRALNDLPLSRASLYARMNLAKSMMRLQKAQVDVSRPLASVEQELQQTQEQARSLGDRRAEAFALGYLGELYEIRYRASGDQNTWTEAKQLTQQALYLSKQIDAQDMVYQWHWQNGRLLSSQNQLDEAIAAYESAVKVLDTLRIDLVTVNLDVQFSFQENVEPIHRELVSLLLRKDDTEHDSDIIKEAQQTIESLQLVELTNFLREACINVETVDVDQVTAQADAAIIYPIILSDRLEIILQLPDSTSGEPLRRKTVIIDQAELEDLMGDFYDGVYNFISLGYRPLAQRAYDLLIRPIEGDLESSGVDTLVFVLDGVLRNVPMAALNDGEQFLVEKYSIALTPGLQLLSPQSLKEERLSVVAVGLTEGVQGFSPLPNVDDEIEQIKQVIPNTQVLLNQEFTKEGFTELLNTSPSPIVHLATHGQFSSQQENTFVLTWNERIKVSDLSQALRAAAEQRAAPIEMLVLSACETASGDRRAALGLAGVAIRAGARSTVASLWQVDDAAAAEMMGAFYTQIAEQKVSRAEALRLAQLQTLENRRFRHPYYWAPFVLVGNWL